MLARTPYTLILLRSAQAAADEKARRQRAEQASAKRAARAMNRQRLNALIDQTAAILKTGQPTMFAYEGAARHGIRSALCLQGWLWIDADFTAASIVAKALHQIGAARPSWSQGQPGYTEDGFSPIERTHCVTCFGKLDAGDLKFCSHACRMTDYNKRSTISGEQRTRAEYLANLAATKAKRALGAEKDCENCGRGFIAPSGKLNQPYCSRACSAEAAKRPDQPCAWCAKPFRPINSDGKYCSADCHVAGMRLPERACEQCGEAFQPINRKTRYCSQTCSGKAQRKDRPEIHCPVCKTVFRLRFPSDTKRHCSLRCSNLARGMNRTGIRCEEVD